VPVRKVHHRQWVRLGALTRLTEIEQDHAVILRAFPDFRKGRGVAGLPSARRKRRRISAASRKAMSVGMRKYWARRKAEASKSRTKRTGDGSE